MSIDLRGYRDKRAIGGVHQFNVQSKFALIGDPCYIHVAALSRRSAAKRESAWEGSVLPVVEGKWQVARLFPGRGGKEELCGAVFWNVEEHGSSCDGVADQLSTLVEHGGDFENNEDLSSELLAMGWRGIGRGGRPFGSYAGGARGNDRLRKDDPARMNIEGWYSNIIGGPTCAFVDEGEYWERLWPLVRQQPALDKEPESDYERIMEAQKKDPVGILELPGASGVVSFFGSQEYLYGRVLFRSTGGRQEATLLMCYTYNCPETFSDLHVEGIAVGKAARALQAAAGAPSGTPSPRSKPAQKGPASAQSGGAKKRPASAAQPTTLRKKPAKA